MPTVYRGAGIRFYFYAADRPEPPHIHADMGAGTGKWWLAPMRRQKHRGLTAQQLRTIEKIIVEHRTQWLEVWNEFFEIRG